MKNLTFVINVFAICYLSHDAQSQWQALTPPLEGMDFLMNMHFVNDSTGFVLQQTFEQTSHYNRILKTTDYGVSWDTIHNVFQDLNLNTFSYEDIFFINEQIGWICGTNMPFILKTTDGGQSWQPHEVNSADSFEQIKFANDTLGFALNRFSGPLGAFTTDAGLTWTASVEASGNDIAFYDECNYVIVGSGYFSNVATCEYELLNFPTNGQFGNRSGRCIYMKNDNEWIAGSTGLMGVNNFGSILATSDGGESFTILDLLFSSRISQLHFLNPELGFATAASVDGLPCSLLKTTDGGISWSCQETPIVISQFGESYYAYFYDMDLRNENLMYAMDQNSIYRTTNGGGPLGDTYTGVKVTPNKIQTLHLYPNPASSIVQLEVSHAMDIREVLVYNSIGQQVEHFSGLPKEIDVEPLAPGCYTAVVRYEKETLSSRFIVE